MRLLIAACLVFGALAPAHAAPPKAEAGHGEEAGDDAASARAVELRGLVFPIFTEEGKLVDYVFADARMLVAEGKDPWKYREQAHFIRDAVLRAAHRTSFNAKGDLKAFDPKLAETECLKAANESVGDSGALDKMEFLQVALQSQGLGR
jgi:hypothetical protein